MIIEEAHTVIVCKFRAEGQSPHERGKARDAPPSVDTSGKGPAGQRPLPFGYDSIRFSHCFRQRSNLDAPVRSFFESFQYCRCCGFCRCTSSVLRRRTGFLNHCLNISGKEICRRRCLAALHIPPHDIASVFRPGHRHIEEPETFRQPFPLGTAAVFLTVWRTDIDGDGIAAVGLVKAERFLRFPPGRPVPVKGTEYHGILKPLALVNGHNRHSIFIALETEFVLFQPRQITISLFRQPGHQSRHGKSAHGRCVMKNLREMKEVGGPPFSVTISHEPGHDLFLLHHGPNHAHDPPIAPSIMIVAKRKHPLSPGSFISHEAFEVFPCHPEDIRDKCTPEERFITRLSNGSENPLHLQGLTGIEEIVHTEKNRGNGKPGEAVLQ